MSRDYDAETVAALASNPAWQTLRTIALEREEQEFQRLARELLRGVTPNEARTAYLRGFFKGMRFLLDKPALELKELEKALAREDVN